MKWLAAVLLLVLAVGCTAPTTGAPVAGGSAAPATTTDPTTTTTTTEPTATTTTGTLAPPPTAIDPAAEQQYCEQPIVGALGKKMNVVVVETPGGRVNCDQAAAVLVDYYGQRHYPNPGESPIEVDGYACNQVPEPDDPQVICADGVSLFYSMWIQGGG